MSEESSPLAGFSGVARLFPLPNLVFYPHVMQPLHIFEPRYRQMTADALAGDRLIALVLPKPGWEENYAGSPALYSVACLGQVVADQKLEDGRYNLLLRGLSRIRLVEEIVHSKQYRKARVELLVEVPLADAREERKLRKRLVELAPRSLNHPGPVQTEFRKLLQSDFPLGALADIVAFALALDCQFKQSLLEELEVEERVRRLIAHLEEKSHSASRPFPPEFSSN